MTGEVTVYGEPVPGTTVQLSGQGATRTTTTDNAGGYTFTAVPAGTWTVTIFPHYGNFASTTRTVTVAAGQTVVANFAGVALVLPAS